VYIGSEDGHLWYVPYDYCLHRADARCNTSPSEPYGADLTRVFPVTAGGSTESSGAEGPVPSSAEITGRLMVRRGGATVYAAMIPVPSTAGLIHTDPPFAFSAQLSGDGRYAFIAPDAFLTPDTTYHVTISGTWGSDGVRAANWTLPFSWLRHGSFSDTLRFRTAPTLGPLPLGVGRNRVSAFELRRLAVPLPAFLPSVNQIGFDSYVLLVGAIAVARPDPTGTGSILLWATQARRGPRGAYIADPNGTLVFPLAGEYRHDTLLLSVHHAVLTFSFGQVPLQRLDMRFQLERSLRALPGANVYAEAQCAQIPNYGVATFITGLCNEQGVLAAAGTFVTNAYPPGGTANRRVRGLSVARVGFRAPTLLAPGSVTVKLALAPGVHYPAADHRIGLLLVDRSGQPLGLDYTAQTTSTDSAASVSTVTLHIPAGTSMPAHLRLYVIADVFPVATRELY
jgi:hypothetical protein